MSVASSPKLHSYQRQMQAPPPPSPNEAFKQPPERSLSLPSTSTQQLQQHLS